MNNLDFCQSYQLNFVIVNHGLGSKVVSIAKNNDIPGGTILLGKGTAKSSFLKFLELADMRKEVVLILSKTTHGKTFLEAVTKKLKLNKPYSGIAFSIPLLNVMGTQYCPENNTLETKKENENMIYDSIFVIVDRGNACHVVEAANESGARGATIINARGSGIHETSKLFSFDIEPEKEIVLILVKKTITQSVCNAIKEKVALDEPGKGILFVQSVDQVYGVL